MEQHQSTPEQKDATIEKVLDCIRRGLPEYASAEQSGISFPTWWRWKNDTPGLTERLNEAKLHRVPILEDRLYKAAMAEKNPSVRALIALLEKYDKGWRDRAKDAPQGPAGPVFVFQGGASVVIGMLSEDKRKKLLGSLHMAGLLSDKIVDIAPSENGGSANGNGNGTAHT